MLITSNYHDYYDVCMKYGMDKSVVYHRKEEYISEENLSKWFDHPLNISYNYGHDVFAHPFMIGFCGNLYYGFYVHAHCLSRCSVVSKSEECFCYSIEDYEKFVSKVDKKSDRENLLSRNDKSDKWQWGGLVLNLSSVEGFFKRCQTKKTDVPFLENNAPVLLLDTRRNKFERAAKNPCLKMFEFYKVIDPYMTYQELSMYISGVLGVGGPETVDISDEDMLLKKGFDDRSFKTMKGDKKPRGKNRGKK